LEDLWKNQAQTGVIDRKTGQLNNKNKQSFNVHFPGGPGLAGTAKNDSILDFIGAKGYGGGANSWS